MHDWWMIDRIEQGQFIVEWSKGKHFISDYFTKRHPSTHQKKLRTIYNYEPGVSPTSLQGFIEILEQAHNLNKPTRALNCLNTQNAGRSFNIHNMNKLQSALLQLDIEHLWLLMDLPEFCVFKQVSVRVGLFRLYAC